MYRKHSFWLPSLGCLTIFLALILVACTRGTPPATGGKLRVLATTSIVGDVVKQVGGNYINLTILMPVGTDPHDFQPRPQDATALSDAQIIFSNGAGLETFLPPLVQSTGAKGKQVEVSMGIDLLPLPRSTQPAGDPHTWMDPNNVVIWSRNIAAALSIADPANAANYQVNADAYASLLHDLDAWIRTEVAIIPQKKRLLVTDHAVLGYFAARYSFIQEGTMTGSFSSEAAPSALELAALEDKIRKLGIKAIFVSEAINQELANQVAADTGIKAVWIYHATLTDAGGPASSYLNFMRYNVNAIVEALK
jgi:ABC-type Zn uptake system ZnuABC Zn-binding protein ZnuA